MREGMKNLDANLLKNLLTLDEEQLYIIMSKFLHKHYKNVVESPRFLYAIGEIPVALIAHLDIVHTKPPMRSLIFHDTEKGMVWSPQGLGADDRAGVYAIVSLVKQGYHPSIIFTCGEEVGGIGANALIRAYRKPLSDLNCIIELDRQGHDECVFYGSNNIDFQFYVQKFGFKVKNGTFTDISIICPSWDLAGTNLSIGYLYEHTQCEFLNLNWLQETTDKVARMLVDYPQERMEYKFAQKVDDGCANCICCGTRHPRQEMIPIMNHTEFDIKYGCVDCVAAERIQLDWCDYCGQAYIIEVRDGIHACPKHRARI